jgi:hypothetical protein
MSQRSKIFVPYIPYGLLETKGEMCVKFGSDRLRNVDLYKVHTNKEEEEEEEEEERLVPHKS